MVNNDFKIWEVGDSYIMIDFGLVKSVEVNIKAALLKEMIVKDNVDGIIESIPSNSSLVIKYSPEIIELTKIVQLINDYLKVIESKNDLEIRSRIIEVPILFDDPWTSACVEDYCSKIKPIENNIELICRENKLDGLEELKAKYLFPQHWVTYVGFTPGLASSLCLDPRCDLSAPKYNPPRLETPTGAIGIGGSNTSIYPLVSAGGFQLFGITPMPILDLEQRLDGFKDSPVLFKVGDRIKYVEIDMNGYNKIKKQVEDGTYHYNIITYDKFCLGEYREFLAEFEAK